MTSCDTLTPCMVGLLVLALSTTAHAQACQPMSSSMCDDMPYDSVILPNSLGHTTQEEAAMELHQFYPLIRIDCSPHLLTFLCTSYLPVCTVLEQPIPVCRELCESARDGCAPLMEKFGFQWPFTCEDLPGAAGGGLCVLGDVAVDTEEVPEEEPETCQPVPSAMCRGMTYLTAGFPNQVGDADAVQASESLDRWDAAVLGECSPYLTMFLCSAQFPLCASDETHLLLPTRQLCQLVKTDCGITLSQAILQWPEYMNCEGFPEDPREFALSVTQEAGMGNEASGSHPDCQPIIHGATTGMCFGIEYNSTVFPNFLGHTTQEDALDNIGMFYFMMRVECSLHLQRFLCGTYFPACSEQGTHVPPCRSLCESVMAGCLSLTDRWGFVWPERLKCANFPESEPCLGPGSW